MPKVSLAETFTDWDQLLRAAMPYANVKDLKVHLVKLQTALQRLQELDGLRKELQAKQQQATQEIGEVREAGKLAAIEIRSVLKGAFGPESERLVQFNMRPRRSHHPKEALLPVPVPDNAGSDE
ncbi:MAG TPA: hypothetical protein VF756_02625 [Thermoanaerobaculia bacterium]